MTHLAVQPRVAAEARDAAEIAALALRCLVLEVDTFPKPGLVSRVDPGSHSDMDATTFMRSATALVPFFAALASAGARGAGMAELRRIGIAAESAMLAATGSVNTHRGAIFGLGLLCAAAGSREGGRAGRALPAIVADRWGKEILGGPRLAGSHGAEAERRFGVGGARAEAASGFPTLVRVGLPALREGIRLAPDDPEAARVHCCFALVAALRDTNLLHRGGREGLRFAQAAARRFLARGGVGRPGWRAAALAVHQAFVARGLSPGGAADLLAMCLFVDAFERPGPIRP